MNDLEKYLQLKGEYNQKSDRIFAGAAANNEVSTIGDEMDRILNKYNDDNKFMYELIKKDPKSFDACSERLISDSVFLAALLMLDNDDLTKIIQSKVSLSFFNEARGLAEILNGDKIKEHAKDVSEAALIRMISNTNDYLIGVRLIQYEPSLYEYASHRLLDEPKFVAEIIRLDSSIDLSKLLVYSNVLKEAKELAKDSKTNESNDKVNPDKVAIIRTLSALQNKNNEDDSKKVDIDDKQLPVVHDYFDKSVDTIKNYQQQNIVDTSNMNSDDNSKTQDNNEPQKDTSSSDPFIDMLMDIITSGKYDLGNDPVSARDLIDSYNRDQKVNSNQNTQSAGNSQDSNVLNSAQQQAASSQQGTAQNGAQNDSQQTSSQQQASGNQGTTQSGTLNNQQQASSQQQSAGNQGTAQNGAQNDQQQTSSQQQSAGSQQGTTQSGAQNNSQQTSSQQQTTGSQAGSNTGANNTQQNNSQPTYDPVQAQMDHDEFVRKVYDPEKQTAKYHIPWEGKNGTIYYLSDEEQEVFDRLKKNLDKKAKFKETFKKAVAFTGGAVVGASLSCVPGIGWVRTGIAGVKVAKAVSGKVVNIIADNNKEGKIAKLRDAAVIGTEAKKEAINQIVDQTIDKIEVKHAKIAKAARVSRDVLKKVPMETFINGLAAGYLAGNIYEFFSHETFIDTIAKGSRHATDVATSVQSASATVDTNSVINHTSTNGTLASSSGGITTGTITAPSGIPAEAVTSSVVENVSSVPEPTQIADLVKSGTTLDISGIEMGRVSSDAANAVHLLQERGENVTFLKEVILNDGTKMWAFNQANGAGYAWFRADDIINYLGKNMENIAEATSHISR